MQHLFGRAIVIGSFELFDQSTMGMRQSLEHLFPIGKELKMLYKKKIAPPLPYKGQMEEIQYSVHMRVFISIRSSA